MEMYNVHYTYCFKKTNILITGSGSRGLRELKDVRKKKYSKHPPMQTALDDLSSQYRLEKEKRQRMLLEADKACSSKSDANNPDFSDDGPNTDINGNNRIPFDIAHPPSPKVSKGPNVKRTSTVVKRAEEVSSSSELSSDVDMRLSGVVASAGVANFDIGSSPSDKLYESSTGKGDIFNNFINYYLISIYDLFLHCNDNLLL